MLLHTICFFSYYILTLFTFTWKLGQRPQEGRSTDGRLVGRPLAFFNNLLKSNIMGVFGSLVMIMLLVTALFGLVATLIQVIKDFNDLD